MNKTIPTTIRELSEMSDEMILVASYRPRDSKRYHTRMLGYREGNELIGVLPVSEKEYNGPLTIRFIDNYLGALFAHAYRQGRYDYIDSKEAQND